jgi:glutamate-1-semialdehyde 2,1-aminomutase
MRAVLSEILTQEFYDKNIPLAERFNNGVQGVIDTFGLPWNTTRLGCRTEYWFRREPAQNGGEAEAAVDVLLDQYMHLASLNRGILMTPFHNMALISAATTEDDIDRHTAVFEEIVGNIL